MRTFLYGYNDWQRRLTVPELETRWAWNRLHPEFRRRLVALFNAAQDAGTDVGVGGGARSSQQQLRVFMERHEQKSLLACCTYDGKRYKLRKGMAHAAPPGRSYHEDDACDGFAVAADLVGDMGFVKDIGSQYGLRVFWDKREPWHVQPLEFTDARSQNGNRKLTVWALPTPVVRPVNDPRPPRQTLRALVVGPDVFVLQRALNNLMGAKLAVDGRMGTQGETVAAVRMWQQFFGLPVTGVVDQGTWKTIYDVGDLKGYRVV